MKRYLLTLENQNLNHIPTGRTLLKKFVWKLVKFVYFVILKIVFSSFFDFQKSYRNSKTFK
jgi:hypothetical protein